MPVLAGRLITSSNYSVQNIQLHKKDDSYRISIAYHAWYEEQRTRAKEHVERKNWAIFQVTKMMWNFLNFIIVEVWIFSAVSNLISVGYTTSETSSDVHSGRWVPHERVQVQMGHRVQSLRVVISTNHKYFMSQLSGAHISPPCDQGLKTKKLVANQIYSLLNFEY